MSGPGVYGQWSPQNFATEYQALAFVIQQIVSRGATCAWVQVVSCSNSGAVSAVGTVTVQPLVNQVTGSGQPVPHGTLTQVPYLRLQGGTSAVIIDPLPGDIGLALFASRDSSLVRKAALGIGLALGKLFNPGSRRQYDWADGAYLGGILNGTPTQYVQISPSGITLSSSQQITLTAPTITIDGSHAVNITGAVDANGATISTAGEVTDALGIVLGTHTHSGVTTGSGTSGPPV